MLFRLAIESIRRKSVIHTQQDGMYHRRTIPPLRLLSNFREKERLRAIRRCRGLSSISDMCAWGAAIRRTEDMLRGEMEVTGRKTGKEMARDFDVSSRRMEGFGRRVQCTGATGFTLAADSILLLTSYQTTRQRRGQRQVLFDSVPAHLLSSSSATMFELQQIQGRETLHVLFYFSRPRRKTSCEQTSVSVVNGILNVRLRKVRILGLAR